MVKNFDDVEVVMSHTPAHDRREIMFRFWNTLSPLAKRRLIERSGVSSEGRALNGRELSDEVSDSLMFPTLIPNLIAIPGTEIGCSQCRASIGEATEYITDSDFLRENMIRFYWRRYGTDRPLLCHRCGSPIAGTVIIEEVDNLPPSVREVAVELQSNNVHIVAMHLCDINGTLLSSDHFPLLQLHAGNSAPCLVEALPVEAEETVTEDIPSVKKGVTGFHVDCSD